MGLAGTSEFRDSTYVDGAGANEAIQSEVLTCFAIFELACCCNTDVSAAFKMSEVERLRALDGKSEFFITVTGSNQVKFFKVKEKFFKSLFN